jgi:hypothetical protein
VYANATGGTLKCTSDCRFDASACSLQCGNGVLDAGEECDGNVFSSAYAGKACKDFQFPSAAFPFFNRVNFASGALTCQDCRVSFSSCKPLSGCYYVTVKTSTTVQCY